MPKISVLIALIITSLSLTAQTQRAESLRSNVVAISAAGQQGFGFVTGSRYDKLFVVTAAHVVEDAVAENASIELKFYDDYNRYTARVIRNYAPEQDIALLEVSKPKYFNWASTCLGQASIGEDVGFIGRNSNWYIPRGRALGTINSFDQDQIVVDITSVTVGTSGAPLIAESGIVGMIINADNVEVRAIHSNQLRTILTKEYSYFFTLTATGSKATSGSSGEKRPVRKNTNQVQDRQGHSYTTKVLKDGKRWMTQNLNLEVDNSWCFDEDPANCAQYGRLYTWEAAKQACVELGEGWHLPTDEEWGSLLAVEEYKAETYEAFVQADNNAFTLLFGGSRLTGGSFLNLGNYGAYWSVTNQKVGQAYGYIVFDDDKELDRFYDDKNVGLSVRCLRDR